MTPAAGRSYSASNPALRGAILASIHFLAGRTATPLPAAWETAHSVLFAHVMARSPGSARCGRCRTPGDAIWPGFLPPGPACLGSMWRVGIAVLAAGHGGFK